MTRIDISREKTKEKKKQRKKSFREDAAPFTAASLSPLSKEEV